MELSIRKGTEADIPEVFRLINELALYEKAPEQVIVDTEELCNDYKNGHFDFFISVSGNQVTGMALFYIRYSTWKGKCIYLEDIIVDEAERRAGIGSQLFKAVVDHARVNGYKGVQWQVLDWNESAINFYKKFNAQFDGEWVNCKITHEQLKEEDSINFKPQIQ